MLTFDERRLSQAGQQGDQRTWLNRISPVSNVVSQSSLAVLDLNDQKIQFQ